VARLARQVPTGGHGLRRAVAVPRGDVRVRLRAAVREAEARGAEPAAGREREARVGRVRVRVRDLLDDDRAEVLTREVQCPGLARARFLARGSADLVARLAGQIPAGGRVLGRAVAVPRGDVGVRLRAPVLQAEARWAEPAAGREAEARVGRIGIRVGDLLDDDLRELPVREGAGVEVARVRRVAHGEAALTARRAGRLLPAGLLRLRDRV